jgi:ubiquinone/menaquinone biosynthesis C-methylase UbiE
VPEAETPSTQDFVRRLLSRDREETLDPFTVLAFTPMEAYDQVADIGCGPGYFSIQIAKQLVHGKVYALDIDDGMLEVLRERVAAAHLGNVEILKCGPMEFPLETESLDGELLAFVVHANEDRAGFLDAARRLLRPGGWCAVLEWYRRETEDGPPLEARIEPEELEELANRSGFRWRWWRDINGSQYMALFRK